jgi:hypothetical protein
VEQNERVAEKFGAILESNEYRLQSNVILTTTHTPTARHRVTTSTELNSALVISLNLRSNYTNQQV